MRMWNVEPKMMCDQHLLGEHVECHMFVGCLNKNKSVKGYVDKGLVEIHNIKPRHEELADEMKKRGMNHQSKLPAYKIIRLGKIDSSKNKVELNKRCKECRKLKK
ncbi:MAG: pyrimidine dimer DNA glycosylase/endonuclease V [archaeon]|nr:pyrimidine dimer DNA glycosylase/endonuclease V [archaeon]